MTRLRTPAVLAAAALVVGCGAEPPPAAPSAPRNPLAVTAPPALRPVVKVGPVPAIEVRETLRVPGRIEVDESRVARVGASVTGRVNDIDATVGQEVRRGEVLATITSTELSATQLEYLRARSQLVLAERAAARAKQLYDAEVIGIAELQRRESELAQIAAEVSAARDQLAVLGVPESALKQLAETRKVNSFAQVVSTVSGTVIERRVTRGQVVQPADMLFLVADLSSVWLVADVPEQRAELLRVGEAIEAEIAALPGERVKGTLSFVAATVNPETRTIKVRMDLPNAERRYKPAMLATVLIKSRATKARAVPAAAIVREDNRDYLFVETGPDAFQLRQVTVGAEHDGQRVIESGVRDGERVVLEGAFQLNVERQQQLTQ